MSGLSISSLAAQQTTKVTTKSESTATQDVPLFSSFMENTSAKTNDFAKEESNKIDTFAKKKVVGVEKNNSKVEEKIIRGETSDDENVYSIAELVANGSVDKACVCQEVLEQVTGAVKDILIEHLGVSADVLESMMEALSLSDEDLLEEDNIKAIIMLAFGISDTIGLTIDEEAYQTLMDVMEAVEATTTEYCEQAGMTVEELKAFVEENATELNVSESNESMVNLPADDMVADEAVTENVSVEKVTEAMEGMVAEQSEESTADDIIVEVKKVSSDSQQAADKTAVVQEVTTDENQNPMAENQGENAAMENGEQKQVVGNVQTNVQTIATENGVQTVFTRLTDALDMVRQIVEQIRVQITPDTTSMEMQLNPENLGKVMLNVSAKNGVVTAQMTVENDVVKAAVESQLIQLKENLNNQGLKVEAVEVSVETRSFERQDQNPSQGKQNAEDIVEKQNIARRRNINLREALAEGGMQEGDLTEEDLLTQRLMKAHGNTIDFMA